MFNAMNNMFGHLRAALMTAFVEPDECEIQIHFPTEGHLYEFVMHLQAADPGNIIKLPRPGDRYTRGEWMGVPYRLTVKDVKEREQIARWLERYPTPLDDLSLAMRIRDIVKGIREMKWAY